MLAVFQLPASMTSVVDAPRAVSSAAGGVFTPPPLTA